MKYEIELTELALNGIKKLKKAGDIQALKKLKKLITPVTILQIPFDIHHTGFTI